MHSNCNRFFTLISNVIFIYLLNTLINLFTICWAGSSLMQGISLPAVRGGDCSLQCTGFSLQWLLLLQSTGSRRAGFRSCSSWALECGSVVVAHLIAP